MEIAVFTSHSAFFDNEVWLLFDPSCNGEAMFSSMSIPRPEKKIETGHYLPGATDWRLEDMDLYRCMRDIKI